MYFICYELFQAENEMSVEELRRKYAELAASAEPMEEDIDNESSDDDDDEDNEEDEEEMEVDGEEEEQHEDSDRDEECSEEGEETPSDEEEEDLGLGLATLMDENFETQDKDTKGDSEKADKELQDASAVAEALQPKGFTLSSTSVTTPIPFLLKHMLREYQHVGLDWLTTMYEKKLNGE